MALATLDSLRGLGAVTFVRAPSGEVIGLTNGNDRTTGLSFTRVDALPSMRK
jgi:hypothetical protein